MKWLWRTTAVAVIDWARVMIAVSPASIGNLTTGRYKGRFAASADRAKVAISVYRAGFEVYDHSVLLAPHGIPRALPQDEFMTRYLDRLDRNEAAVLERVTAQLSQASSATEEQTHALAGSSAEVSDTIAGLASFLRCSSDHHNLLVQPAPVPLVHHTSWQMDDVDEVGRAAQRMLAQDPQRHVWGLGRHHIGSNFFWYLKDPAGNFTEYYADLDCIPEDAVWTPEVWEGARGLYNWGPPPPPSFLAPDDLAELMAQAHA